MTKEKILQLLDKALNDNVEDVLNKPDISRDAYAKDFLLLFARALLLECAKAVCINCKEGNISEPTHEPHRRVHRISATYQESCRAPSFFLEGE